MFEGDLIEKIDVSIEKILIKFIQNGRLYILFAIKDFSPLFLYSVGIKKNYMSLFYGNNFLENILKLKNRSTCIECSLGTLIKGGVSYDNGEIVDFNLSILKANKIITILKLKIKNENLSDNKNNHCREFGMILDFNEIIKV